MFGKKSSNALLKELPALAKKEEAYLLECRRTVHRFAEVAGTEEKTAAFIKAEADKLGLPYETVSKTGFIVTMDTGRAGNGVALRADMDALPVTENPNNLKGPRSVLSENPGCSHACGHDCHVAMLLTAMRILNGLKDKLSGVIYFCFEEGEETGTGWTGMVDALEKKNINTVFGLHVYAGLEHGLVSIEPGPRMSGTVNINATFVGKGGHGSRPDLSVNPVFAAANAICNTAVAFENQLDVNETVTLGFTGISGSAVNNVFPDTSTVLGTLRFFNPEEGRKAVKLLKTVFNHTAFMHRCTVDYMMTDIILEPVLNDPDASALAEKALGAVLPEGSISTVDKWYASESFSEYLRRYKGVLGFIGIRNEEKGCAAEHHNECFDVDESALINGVLAHTAYTVEALNSKEIAEWPYTEPEIPDDDDEEMPPLDVPAARGVTAGASDGASAGVEGTEPSGADGAPAAPKKPAKYTLDTKIGVLLKSEGAKQAVASVVDGLVNHPQIGFAKGMSIRKASGILPKVLTPEILTKIEAALAEVED